MSIKTYNTSPYYDDFDKSKNYLRVLFRPGRAVQARELTQMQTAIQAQLDRFGSNIFKDGSPVVGGQASLDTAYSYIKIYSSFTYSGPTVGGITNGTALISDNYYSDLVGSVITGQTTGITAKVVNAVAATNSGDPLTIFVKYTSSGTDKVAKVFSAGEYLLSDGSNGQSVRLVQVKNLLSVDPTNGDDLPTGYGANVSVTEGAFFISGNFAYAAPQSIILSKYSNNPTARIVYKITEEVVSSTEDITLSDNALGAPNFAAPGADRYAISLQLIVQPIAFADRTEANIIQLLVIVNGVVNSPANNPYSAIGDTMAKRTFEEAGNFVVNPFLLNLREYLNTGTNGGLLTTDQIIANGDATNSTDATTFGSAKIAVGIEKSTAYVDGYRIELVDTKYVSLNKARDVSSAHELSLIASVGSFVAITNIVGVPDINTFSKITLKNNSSTTIGYARVRSLEYVSGSGSGAIYNLYLFDLQMLSTYAFSSTHTFYCSYGTGAAFQATAVDSSPLLAGGNNSMLFQLPRSVCKSLLTSGLSYTSYSVKKRYDPNPADGSGNVTLTPIANEIFYSIDENEYVVVKNSDGSIVPQTAVPTLTSSGGGSVVTVTLHLGSGNAGLSVHIIAPSSRYLTQKTKTLQTAQEIILDTPNTVSGGYDLLNVTDLVSVSNIYMSANNSTDPTTSDINVTNRYYVDNGQRDNFYDVARIQLIPGQAAPTGRLLVVYSYLQHGAGDYFSVDSYTGVVDYVNIPSFQSSQGLLQLRDVLDFRPTKDLSGEFTGAGASVGATIIPNTAVVFDIHYYLPRIDKIYVDKKGNFAITQGVSADKPVAPLDPDGSMILYTVTINPYTFNAKDVLPTMIDNRRYTMRDIGSIDSRLKNVEYYTALSLLENSTAATQIIDPATGTPYYQHGFVVDSFTGSSVGNVSNPDYSVSIENAAGVCRPSFFQDNVKLQYNSSLSTGIMKTGSLLTIQYYETDYIKQPYASNTLFVNPFDVFNWTGTLQISPASDDWKDTVQAPDVVINDNGAYDSLAAQISSSAALGTVWNDWQTTWSGVTSTSISDSFGLTGTEALLLKQYANTTTVTTTNTTDQTRTGTQTSLSSTVNTQSYGNIVVDVSVIPFIRSRIIFFWGTGLKPNTKLYPFFDSTPVTSYCRQLTPTGGSTYTDKYNYWITLQYSNLTTSSLVSGTAIGSRPITAASGNTAITGPSDLITDSAGDVFGAFLIPNNGVYQFKTGTRIFRLCDSVTNTSDLVTTSAEASYAAQGLLDTVSNLIVSTQVPTVNTTQVTDTRVLTNVTSSQTTSNAVTNTVAPSYPAPTQGTIAPFPLTITGPALPTPTSSSAPSTFVGPVLPSGVGGVSVPGATLGDGTSTTLPTTPVTVGGPTLVAPINVGGGGGMAIIQPGVPQIPGVPSNQIYYLDPLAQSFLVDMQGGIMATSIDIYFQAKDPSLPVTLSIVTMENGSPTEKILPFSTVTLPASSINVSSYAATATTFTFSAPVMLLQGVEYAFVLHSNSNLYKVWISELGNYDVTNTTFRITEQPYAGVLFESQNSSTWTPNQTSDIKFLIRRAAFSMDGGSVILNECPLPTAALIPDPLYFTNSSNVVRVYHSNNGMFVGSSVVLSGVVANSGSAVNGIPITQLNKTLTVTSVEIDSYTVQTTASATTTGRAGGSAILATENKTIDVMDPIIQDIVMPDTNINWSAKLTSGKSLAGSETPYVLSDYVPVKENDNTFMKYPQTILSTAEVGNVSDSNGYSFYLKAAMTTKRNNISPIIDLDRASLVTVAHRIDNPSNTNPAPVGYNYVTGYLPDSSAIGGSALSKYLTKQITLDNPAESLTIIMGVNQPSGSYISVYFKIPNPSQLDTSFDSIPWTLANPDKSIPVSDDPNVYKEVTYTVDTADIQASVNASSAVYFSSFAIKVVFYSQNSSQVPTIKNFRAIALS